MLAGTTWKIKGEQAMSELQKKWAKLTPEQRKVVGAAISRQVGSEPKKPAKTAVKAKTKKK